MRFILTLTLRALATLAAADSFTSIGKGRGR